MLVLIDVNGMNRFLRLADEHGLVRINRFHSGIKLSSSAGSG